MEPTVAPPQLPPSATVNYPDSIDSSPRSRNTDSWADDNSRYHDSLAAAKLRLMCSYGGHIVPRPHDKTLCYVGGDTRIVVVDRRSTLQDLIHCLSKTILRSSSSATSFTLKYQLPSEELDSLISVTTDEDLENMIDEYERLNSSSAVNKSSRLRLFIFPTKPESVSSIGSLLENSSKSEDWFLDALNGTTSGFSDTSSVNCLLGLDDEVPATEKKDVNHKGGMGTNLRGNSSVQDVHSIPDSPMKETTSSFGSASSTPSLANLPPIRVNVDDHHKVGGGGRIEDQFSQMSVHQHHKHQDDGGFAAKPVPVVVSGSPMSSAAVIPEYPNPVFADDDSQKGQPKHQQQQFHQKQPMGFDLASQGSVSSDGATTIYHDSILQIQSSNNNNRSADQNTKIQIQQQIQDSATAIHHLYPQQQQLIDTTTAPPPHYIHHHPSGAVPISSYYQIHPSQAAMEQQNYVYYMSAGKPPYNFPLHQQHSRDPTLATTAPPPNNPAPPYAATRTAPQLVHLSSTQHHQPHCIGFSQIHHPSHSIPSTASDGRHIYYAAPPHPPQSAAQYQTIEAGSHLFTDKNMNQQQVRTAQP